MALQSVGSGHAGLWSGWHHKWRVWHHHITGAHTSVGLCSGSSSPHTWSLLDVHHGNGHVDWQGVLVATLGGHLVLQGIEVHIHVSRANVGRVLEVCGVANHGAVDSPPPLGCGLLGHAAGKALDPDVPHLATLRLLLARPTLAATAAVMARCLLLLRLRDSRRFCLSGHGRSVHGFLQGGAKQAPSHLFPYRAWRWRGDTGLLPNLADRLPGTWGPARSAHNFAHARTMPCGVRNCCRKRRIKCPSHQACGYIYPPHCQTLRCLPFVPPYVRS